ncbi:MAG: hypothetical protein C0518_07740 [Opitutus sp.]|nr:hypothetical protein [Opitutus sp.]
MKISRWSLVFFLAGPLGAAEPIAPDLTTLGRTNAGWELPRFPSLGQSANSDRPNSITAGATTGAYVAGVELAEGTIEFEARGRAADGSSFVGVMFHGVDGTTYDGVYFRSFNFGHDNPVKRDHAVQYIAMPEWPWHRLRRERPEEFENPVTPTPKPDEWFRARVVVEEGRVRVFVNDATEPSLEVERLSTRGRGKVGLWVTGFGDIANLKITPKS